MTRRAIPGETKGMALLSGLFFLRVLGQLLVSRKPRRWLPPMEQWQSGLMPYPALLASQAAILTLQTTIELQSVRGEGALVEHRPRAGRALRGLSVVYVGGMIYRYIVSMRRHPERRWFGKTIPIWFHMILATYLFLYARLISRNRHTAGH
jgi:hypothetical protein